MNIKVIFKGVFRLIFIALVSIFAVAVIVAIVCVIKDDPQPLEVAVAVLTILVAIVAIFVGWTAIRIRDDWYKFREKTDENWQKADNRLQKLEKSQREIDYLEEHIVTDPLLQHPEDRKRLVDFAKVFIAGQDMFPLKFYLAGRAYEDGYDRTISIEEQLEKSIQYYNKALDCEKVSGYEMGSTMKRRICQAMGFSLSELGNKYLKEKNQPKAKEYYEKAREAFHDADEAEHSSHALDSKGNACIKLANMASDNKEVKAKLLTEAIECFDGAIQMKDKLVRDWWATFHFDKARALALSVDEDDKREDLDKVVEEVGEELNKAIDKVVPEPVGFDDLNEVFLDFKNVKAYDEINRLLERLREVILQARLKRD